jgi:PBSX family phage terminase large subunit
MKLTPAQSLIAKDKHRFRVINAGRRFGKSTLVSWEMLAIAVNNENARVPYYAPTRDDARDIMWGMLKKVCEPVIIDVNEGRLEITIQNKFGGKSYMLLYGWEAVQERGKGVGVRNNHIFLDEVSKYKNFWVGWHEILRPTLTDLEGGATFISTPNGFNHFYDLYGMELKDEDYKSFHFTSYDNPFLPIKELDKAKLELPEDRFHQEYMADFRKQEGLVYKEFNRDRHVIEVLPETVVEYIAGIDFGFTNPTAVIHIKKDRDNNYFVTEEWYKTGRTEEQIGGYVKSCKFNKVYPDPESPSAIDVLNSKGVLVMEVVKNKDSIQNGINRVRTLLKTGKLYIHKSCVNLIAEFETYAYPEKRPGMNEYENPIKEHDHALDALRYALSSHTENSFITSEDRARLFLERSRNIRNNAR